MRRLHKHAHEPSDRHAAVAPLSPKKRLYDDDTAVVLRPPPPVRLAYVLAVAALIGVALTSWLVHEASFSTTVSAPDDPETTAFLTWIESHGGRVSDAISIDSFEDMGRGIVARAPLAEHDELAFVPLDLIMCRDTIWKVAPPTLLAKYHKLRDAPTELLTAFLLLEQFRRESSLWAPYLRLLPAFPSDVDDIASPLFYASSETVDELQDPRMIDAATLERRHAKTAFHRFRRLFKNVLPVDAAVTTHLEQRYLWARFLINSRAFSIRGERFLVPLGDMFNGKAQPTERSDGNGAHFLQYHRLDDGVGMEILADRAVADVGDQVFEDYGDNDNYVYFLYHGFLMDANPFDCAAVALSVPLDRSVAKSLLEQSGGSRFVCVTAEGTLRAPHDQHAVQRYASVLAMDDAYAQALCAQKETYPLCLSYATPAEQQELLASAIRDQLHQYATTASDDVELLSNDTTPRALQHAIGFRLSRKEILTSALAELETMATQRRSPLPEAEVQTRKGSIDKRMQRFSKWIETLDFPVNHVELQYVSPRMGFGAFATKTLAKGEIYLSVPTDIVMDTHSAVRSPWIRDLVMHSHRRWTDAQLLLLHLLHETFAPGHASRWRPYLDILPSQSRHGSPLFYAADDPELELLHEAVPHDLYHLVEEYRSRVDTEYRELIRELPDLRNWLTLARFRWANAILDSRSIWWSGSRHLVPLLDMVNCVELSPDHAPHATRLVSTNDAAVTHASYAFAKGGHIVENYAQANYIYLLYHGFVLDENSHDCAHFHFDLDRARRLSSQSSHRKDVIRIIETMGLYSWSQDVCVGRQKSEKSLETLLRLAIIAESPQRAAEVDTRARGAITAEHVDAAMRETTERIARLEATIAKHPNAPKTSILSYIHQQLRRMEEVLEQLQKY